MFVLVYVVLCVEEPTLSDEESSSDSDCASDETYEALSEISDSAR